MQATQNTARASVLFIPHGGGPLPLLGDQGHASLVVFLRGIAATLPPPAAIVVVSAHWEEDQPTITCGARPALIYDYYGFPAASYDIQYPAPGDPALAARLHGLLARHGISATLTDQRGLDHGVFVPLKLMYPGADIPCVQLSLVKGLDPATHIHIGKALADVRRDNVLVVGSGFSFHNMKAFMAPRTGDGDVQNEAFERWLIDTCTDPVISEAQREQRLIAWARAPAARYCHPREEHLMPLHVCYGLGGSSARLIFAGEVLGKKTCAFLW